MAHGRPESVFEAPCPCGPLNVLPGYHLSEFLSSPVSSVSGECWLTLQISDLLSSRKHRRPPWAVHCAVPIGIHSSLPAHNLIPSCQESQPLESKWPVFTFLAALDHVLWLRALSRCSANASGMNDAGVTGTEPTPDMGGPGPPQQEVDVTAAVRARD